MIPSDFPETNTLFGPPPGLDESQVRPIPAYVGTVARGSVEGSSIVVVAWTPTPQDRVRIEEGGVIYLSMLSGLAPHFLTTTFQEAISPA